MKLKVPFYRQNRKMNCGPAALKIALSYLGKNHSMNKLGELVKAKESKAVSTIQLAIATQHLGFRTEFYSKVIGLNPENLKLEFYKKQSDMKKKSQFDELFQTAKKEGVEIFKKTIPLEEIIRNIKEDRIMIILLDWNIVRGKEGYNGHFVPIVGHSKNNIYVHNQGFHNTKAYFSIEKTIFEKARKAKGTDEDILIIYRK